MAGRRCIHQGLPVSPELVSLNIGFVDEAGSYWKSTHKLGFVFTIGTKRWYAESVRDRDAAQGFAPDKYNAFPGCHKGSGFFSVCRNLRNHT